MRAHQKRKRPAAEATGRFENDHQLGSGVIGSKKYPTPRPSASALRAARLLAVPIAHIIDRKAP